MMNKWAPETRSRILILAVCTTAILVSIWLVLIGTLQETLRTRTYRIRAVQDRLRVTRAGIGQAEKYHDAIRRGAVLLGARESEMAQGDLYRWVINNLREVQQRHNVTITTFNPPQVGPLGIPPKVPYKAGSYSIAGRARYHDFGSFLADLENSSPFVRLKSLSLEATASGVTEAADAEDLIFRMEFVTLVKSTTP